MKLIILALAILCATASMAQAQKTKLPDLLLETLDGKEVNMNTFNNDGKPFVIVCWASWSSLSKGQLRLIQDLHEKWVEETGVKIIAISLDDSRQKQRVISYVDQQEWDIYEHYIDLNKDIYSVMSVDHPPHTYLFNGKGELVWELVEFVDDDAEVLFEEIKKCSK